MNLKFQRAYSWIPEHWAVHSDKDSILYLRLCNQNPVKWITMNTRQSSDRKRMFRCNGYLLVAVTKKTLAKNS